MLREIILEACFHHGIKKKYFLSEFFFAQNCDKLTIAELWDKKLQLPFLLHGGKKKLNC